MVAARPLLWPAAFLLAVTLAVFGVRATIFSHHQPSKPSSAVASSHGRYYRVRAGDTLATIAARTGVSVARLRRLNPKASTTALFLGQKLKLP